MRMIAVVIVFLAGMITPALAQKAEIEAVNAKWMEFFNKGDLPGSGRSTPRTRPHSRRALAW